MKFSGMKGVFASAMIWQRNIVSSRQICQGASADAAFATYSVGINWQRRRFYNSVHSDKIIDPILPNRSRSSEPLIENILS